MKLLITTLTLFILTIGLVIYIDNEREYNYECDFNVYDDNYNVMVILDKPEYYETIDGIDMYSINVEGYGTMYFELDIEDVYCKRILIK